MGTKRITAHYQEGGVRKTLDIDALPGTRHMLIPQAATEMLRQHADGGRVCFEGLLDVVSRAPMPTNAEIRRLEQAIENALEWVEIGGFGGGKDTHELTVSTTQWTLQHLGNDEYKIAVVDGDEPASLGWSGEAWTGGSATIGGISPIFEAYAEVSGSVLFRSVICGLRHIPSKWVKSAKIDAKAEGFRERRWRERLTGAPYPNSGPPDYTPWLESEVLNDSDEGEVCFGIFTLTPDGEGGYTIGGGSVALPGIVGNLWNTIDITGPLKFLMNNPGKTYYIAPMAAVEEIQDIEGLTNEQFFLSWITPKQLTIPEGQPSDWVTYLRHTYGGIQFRGLKIQLDLDAVRRDMPKNLYGATGMINMPPLRGEDEA